MGKYSNEFKAQVVEYYKTHTAKETAQKFSMPVSTSNLPVIIKSNLLRPYH